MGRPPFRPLQDRIRPGALARALARLVAALALGLALGTAAPARGDVTPRRLALVVGNNRYKDSPLTNPVNDALAMSRTLKDVGFTVTTLTDATLAQMTEAVRQFGDALVHGEVGLFFYAGHGMQIKGRNFLIPVDSDIRREDEVQYKSFDANQVLDKMESAHNPVNIVILDACRNNPFARSFRSASSGLAQMDAPVGTYISFATAPGKVASDGSGGNGLFTQHLLKALRTPELKLEEVFKQVRVSVMKDSSNQQIPWDSSSLTGDFYFARSSAGPAPTAVPPPAPAPVPSATTASVPASPAETGEPPAPIPAKAELKKAAPTAAKTRDLALAQEAFGKGQEAQKRGDARNALAQFEVAAEHGSAGAQFELGQLHKAGRAPVRQDLAAARRWFLKAAEQGQAAAQFELGRMCEAGQGGAHSCRDAEHWLKKAAEHGHGEAMLQLAWHYQRGCDGDKKPAEAARWMKAAALKGARDAQFSLGVMYFSGEGVAKDAKEARRWLEAAAAQGHPSAKFYLNRLE